MPDLYKFVYTQKNINMKGITINIELTRERLFLKDFVAEIMKRDTKDKKLLAGKITELITFLLRKQPKGHKQKLLGISTLVIEIPDDNYKNPVYFNYLSEASERFIEQKILDWFIELYIYNVQCYRQDFTLKDITFMFMAYYNIHESKFDMLVKRYQRLKRDANPKIFANILPIVSAPMSFSCPVNVL